jgi:hypothetical protein
MDCETVDIFHNSVCGYRAQYYHNVKKGESANRYLTQLLSVRINELLSGKNKPTCPPSFIKKSLSDVHAKVWIHQGLWLRTEKNRHKNLQVKRWVKQQTSTDEKKRKRAIWASLTPGEETRIDFKGGYFTLDEKPLGKSMKPNRGNDIHEYGFT